MASSFSLTSMPNTPLLTPLQHYYSHPNKSLFPQTSQLLLSKTNRYSHHRPKLLTVSAITENGRPNNDRMIVDRRNMLFTLGGAAITGGSAPGLALPVAPDVDKDCMLTNNTESAAGSIQRACCLNLKGLPVKDFKFDDYKTAMKTRRPAHKVVWDSQYHKDLKAAIAEMRKLDVDDPRSLYMQSLIHCAYCDAAYMQKDNPNKRFMIHDSWLFYPFHRWELFFFERIAGSLIGKPDFALPFWAWDIPESMRIPDIYEKDCRSSLYDQTRDETHRSGVVDLRFLGDERGLSDDQLMQDNLKAVKEQMLGNNNDVTAELFYGSKYKAGDDKAPGPGTIEKGAHTGVHAWTGGNMGLFWTAGMDPLFYGLHANVDRLWYVWENKLGKGGDIYIQDNDFLNASFVFYDENKQAVRVTVKDCLDIEKLCYRYEDMPMPWSDDKDQDQGNNQGPGGGIWGPSKDDWGPKPGDWGPKPGDWGPKPGEWGPKPGEWGPKPGEWGNKGLGPTLNARPTAVYTMMSPLSEVAAYPLDKAIMAKVERPKKSIKKQEEVMVVDMELSHTKDPSISFDVYINGDNHDDDMWQTSARHYVGRFATLPMKHSGGDHKMNTSVKLPLNYAIQQIGAQNNHTLNVNLVPLKGQDAILITGIKIDHLQG